jgi:hypothetical protein
MMSKKHSIRTGLVVSGASFMSSPYGHHRDRPPSVR